MTDAAPADLLAHVTLGGHSVGLKHLSTERLTELASQGWLEKHEAWFDDREEEYDVTRDEHGQPWSNGYRVCEAEVYTAWAPTDKLRATREARRAKLKQSLDFALKSVQRAAELATGLDLAEALDPLGRIESELLAIVL